MIDAFNFGIWASCKGLFVLAGYSLPILTLWFIGIWIKYFFKKWIKSHE